MLPTNVMSFVKKMVSSGAAGQNQDDVIGGGSGGGGCVVGGIGLKMIDKGTAATLTRPHAPPSSPVTEFQPVKERTATSPVPDGADMSHLTAEEISILQKVFEKQQQFEKEEATRKKTERGKPISRTNSCRICLKGLVATDVFRICCVCQHKVCEDCSSYSKQDNSNENEPWLCSICRRKLADQQKCLQDPEAQSRFAQRGRSVRRTMGNGSGSSSQLSSSLGSTEFIETTPKLRPRTLDTTTSSFSSTDRTRHLQDLNSCSWINNHRHDPGGSSSTGSGSELRSGNSTDTLKEYRNFSEPNNASVTASSTSATNGGPAYSKSFHSHHSASNHYHTTNHQHHHRRVPPLSGYHHNSPYHASAGSHHHSQPEVGGGDSSNGCVDGSMLDRTRKHGTYVRPYTSETEDSDKRSSGLQRISDYYLSDENSGEINGGGVTSTPSGGRSREHAHLRHVHSDSGGPGSMMGKYRLSPEIMKERHQRPRQSPSTSDSSLEESWRDEPKDAQDTHWRRKKSKVKRRSRVQRQRSYHDDSLDVTVNGETNHQGGGATRHPGDGADDDENGGGGDVEEEAEQQRGDFHRHRRDQTQLLAPPGHSRIIRHHSWDASLAARRYSSESSDVSDVSGDYPQESLDQDENAGGNGFHHADQHQHSRTRRVRDDRHYENGGTGSLDNEETGVATINLVGGSGSLDSAGGNGSIDLGDYPPDHPFRLGLLKPRPPVRKLSRKKKIDSEEDYDAEQSATMESSPSPEHLERGSHSFPHMERRTSSEDSEVFKGGRGSRRSSSQNVGGGAPSTVALPPVTQGGNWPIPIVEVHVADPHDHSDTIKSESSSERSSGRSLPKIPGSSNGRLPNPAPRTRQSKSVDLTPIGGTGLVEKPTESLLRRSTLSDFDSVKIVIDDVDSNNLKDKPRKVMERKVFLSRLPMDGGHRTRGFGLRVVGGKIGEDGRLFAYVVWTVPEGPAEQSGIVKGDKILEWNGESLVDLSFEEVCAIMDHSGDEVVVIVEHVSETPAIRHSSFDNGQMHLPIPEQLLRRSSEGSGLGADSKTIIALESSKQDVLPTRRRLPKPPEAPSDVSAGEIQLVIWFDNSQPVFTVTVVEGQDLPYRSDNSTSPEAYAKVRLLPEKNKTGSFKTPIAEPSTNPSWNESFSYMGISAEDIVEKILVISVWDIISDTEKRSLGEIVLPLNKCAMDGRAEWYRLRDRRSLVSAGSPKSSKRSLKVPLGGGAELMSDSAWRRADFYQSRSLSDDIDEQLALELIGHIVKSTSVDSNLLHPEQAWNRDRRRSSSGSEKSDISTHSCPHSLPSTRKNSFNMDSYYDENAVRERLRTRSFKLPKPESLKVARDKEIIKTGVVTSSTRHARSFSLKADKRSISMVDVSNMNSPHTMPVTHSLASASSPAFPAAAVEGAAVALGYGDAEAPGNGREVSNNRPRLQRASLAIHSEILSPLSLHSSSSSSHLWPKSYLALPGRNKWSSSSSLEASDDDLVSDDNARKDPSLGSTEEIDPSLHLGPAQVQPKNFTGILGSNQKEIKLGIIITKGVMEIEVISARGISYSTSGQAPDTYVKTYLKEGEKRLQKKKTRVVRHSIDPQYRQTLRYPATEINGRFLLVMVWERQKGFDHNQGIGAAQINPDKLELNKLVIGWYRLFPMAKIESESNEST